MNSPELPVPEGSAAGAGQPIRIYAVIVFYGREARASATLRTLLASAALVEAGRLNLRVLLFSNSAGAFLPPPEAPAFVTAQSGHGNEGLAGAYNAALRDAAAEGYDWLLTLDHDSELPLHFLPRLCAAARSQAAVPAVAACVPHLVEADRVLSPVRVLFGRTRPLPVSFTGVARGEVRAYNSGALLRVAALLGVGAFPAHFWLDYLDSALHHALYRAGKRVYVVDGLVLPHRLSLLNYRERLTPERFRNFLFAESAYRDLYCGPLERVVYTAQLAGRWWRQWRRGDDRGIRAATCECLRSRLFKRRGTRLREWRRSMELRQRVAASSTSQAAVAGAEA